MSATTAPPSPRGSQLWIETAASAAELRSHEAAWNLLAEHAAEANPFYEPWMLLPALDAFATDGSVQVAMVYRNSRRTDSPPEMCGLFPLHRVRMGRWPFHAWRMWQHAYDFSCVPLVRRDCATETVASLGRWIAREADGASLWDLHHITGDGLFSSALLEAARKGSWHVYCADMYHRALLRCAADAETYCSDGTPTKTRQEHRRLRRRLEDVGRLEFRDWGSDPEVDLWTRQFLELEQAGWKGRGETAMADCPADRQYFETIVRQGAAHGRVAMLGLFLDGEPIALKCNFLSPPGSYAFKIAFREEYGRYSPGVQLELDNIAWVHQRTDLEWMDSCAVRDHFMINRLWHQRRTVQRLILSPGCRTGDLAIGLMQAASSVRSALRPQRSAASEDM